MNISVVAATEMEINALRNDPLQSDHDVTFHVHGVGMMQAAYSILKVALSKPDLIIQCGIAGTYSDQFNIGETVVVYSECLGDTGAEDHNDLLDLFDLDLLNKNQFPFTNGLLLNEDALKIQTLKTVNSITVNLTAGNERTIEQRRKKFNADIETMEGAALHFVCLQEKIPFMQFRGISNRVEPRDKNKWKIEEALQNCHKEVIKYIQQLS